MILSPESITKIDHYMEKLCIDKVSMQFYTDRTIYSSSGI